MFTWCQNGSHAVSTAIGDDTELDCKLFIVILEFIIIFPIFIANMSTLIVIRKFKILQNPANMMIACLACVDLVAGITYLPYDIMTTLFPCLNAYRIVCLLKPFLVLVSYGASVTVMAMMALERMVAIYFPYFYLGHVTWRKNIKLTTVAILLMLIPGIVPLSGWNNWPASVNCDVRKVFPSQVVFCIMLIMTLQIVFIISANILVLCKALKVTRQINIQKRDFHSVSSHTTPIYVQTFTSVVVFGVFMLFWIPSIALIIVSVVGDVPRRAEYTQIAICIGMCNSCANPIIYAWRKEKFRKAYKRLFCRTHEQEQSQTSGSKTRLQMAVVFRNL